MQSVLWSRCTGIADLKLLSNDRWRALPATHTTTHTTITAAWCTRFGIQALQQIAGMELAHVYCLHSPMHRCSPYPFLCGLLAMACAHSL